MNPLSPNTPPASFRIFSTADPFSFAMSCWLPVTGSETKVMRPCRFATISEPCPVVLYFPDHSFLSPSQDQHGHRVPSTSAIAPLVTSAASTAAGRSSSVAFSTNGVRKRDVPRYRGLGDVEDFGPYILDDVLPQISARNDQCLPQVQFARAPLSFIPWFFEEFADHLLQFIELR